MFEQLLPHVPLHLRAHYVPLTAHVIAAQRLHYICREKHGSKKRQRPHDSFRRSLKQRLRQISKRLRKGKVNQTDDHRA